MRVGAPALKLVQPVCPHGTMSGTHLKTQYIGIQCGVRVKSIQVCIVDVEVATIRSYSYSILSLFYMSRGTDMRGSDC